jgi:hypothetical protein
MSTASARIRAEIRTPLSLIAVILGMSDLFVGAAATQTIGWIQGMFAIVCVLLPVGIAAAVFVFLWKRPLVLYGAREAHLDAYMRAISMHRRALSTQADGYATGIEEAVAVAVAAGRADVAQLVERAVSTAGRVADARSVAVDISAFRPDAPPVRFFADQASEVSELLDFVYFSLAPVVRPWTYGEQWLLRKADGTMLVNLGSSWARGERRDRDDRALHTLGVVAGDQLVAVPVHSA